MLINDLYSSVPGCSFPLHLLWNTTTSKWTFFHEFASKEWCKRLNHVLMQKIRVKFGTDFLKIASKSPPPFLKFQNEDFGKVKKKGNTVVLWFLMNFVLGVCSLLKFCAEHGIAVICNQNHFAVSQIKTCALNVPNSQPYSMINLSNTCAIFDCQNNSKHFLCLFWEFLRFLCINFGLFGHKV